jgi:hypothetical protein
VFCCTVDGSPHALTWSSRRRSLISFSLCAKERYEDHLLNLARRDIGSAGCREPSAGETVKALVPTTVKVPLSLQTAPFDRDRVLMVPPGFSISVVARIPAARFIAPLSTGEILVARPATGSILVIRPQANGMVGVSSLIDRLSYAQGMALL